jgi:hypothetical protein
MDLLGAHEKTRPVFLSHGGVDCRQTPDLKMWRHRLFSVQAALSALVENAPQSENPLGIRCIH